MSVSGPSAPTTHVSSTRTPHGPVYNPQLPTASTTLAGSGGGAFSPWKKACPGGMHLPAAPFKPFLITHLTHLIVSLFIENDRLIELAAHRPGSAARGAKRSGVRGNPLFRAQRGFPSSTPVIVKHRSCSFRDKGIGAILPADRDDDIARFLELPEAAILHLGAQQLQGA